MIVRETNPKNFGKDLGLLHELIIKCREHGAGRFFWKSLLENNNNFLDKTIQLAKEYSCLDYVGKYLSPALQWQMAKEMNNHFNWGFNYNDFESIKNFSFSWDPNSGERIVLDITLDTPQATFAAVINCLKLVYNRVSINFEFCKEPIAAGGANFNRGLRWVFLDYANKIEHRMRQSSSFSDSFETDSNRFFEQQGLSRANSAGLWELFYFIDAYGKNNYLEAILPNIRGYKVEYSIIGEKDTSDNLLTIAGNGDLIIRAEAMVNSTASDIMTQKLLI